MSLYVLDAVCRMIGIRGHVPPNGDLPAGPNEPSLGTNTKRLMRMLAAVVLTITCLSLVLWVAVWLSLYLLYRLRAIRNAASSPRAADAGKNQWRVRISAPVSGRWFSHARHHDPGFRQG